MTRCGTTLSVGAGLFVFLAGGPRWGAWPPPMDPIAVHTPTEAWTEECPALCKTLPTLTLEHATLDEVAATLSELSGVDVLVDRAGLAASEFPGGWTVDCRLRAPTLATALRVVLDSASRELPALDYECVNGVVRISTQDILDRRFVVRIYDARGVIAVLERWDELRMKREVDLAAGALERLTKARGIEVAATTLNAAVLASNAWPDDWVCRGTLEADAEDRLASLLTMTIEPDMWIYNGGMGVLECRAGRLVVRAPARVQTQIAAMLNALQRALTTP